ncbi:hypothetical protein [Chelativorans sp.]|nr:hypothetical protein [Chelativorans sp.]
MMIGLSMAAGIAIGAVLGEALFDSIPVGMIMGGAIGTAFALMVKPRG